MKANTVIKILGTVAPILSSGLTFVISWVDGKNLDNKIDERIRKALAGFQEIKPE